MYKLNKWWVLGLSGLVAAAGATVLTAPTWSRSAPGRLLGWSSSGSGAGLEQQAATREERPGRYIIVYREAPLASYDGKVPGLPAPPSLAATSRHRTTGSDRIDVKSAQARAYVAHLQKRQKLHENTIAGTLGHRLNVHRRMQHALNAEIVDLTVDEAARVAKLPDVALVEA